MSNDHHHAHGDELDPLAMFGADNPCFGCSPSHPHGLRLRFRRVENVIRVTFTPREEQQGPPGIMHGGLVATLADELAAWTVVGLRERFGFTASMELRLQRPLRLGAACEGEGTIVSESARTVKTAVTLSQNGERILSGQFTFVLMDQEAAEKMLGGPLPDAWKRFARPST